MVDTELPPERLKKLLFPHPSVGEAIRDALFQKIPSFDATREPKALATKADCAIYQKLRSKEAVRLAISAGEERSFGNILLTAEVI